MHDHWLFIGNVFAHWVAAMSGVVSFAFGIFEYVRDRKTEARLFAVVAFLFLMVSFDFAWQDEHRNATVLIAEKSMLTHDRDFWESQSYQKDASIRAQNQVTVGYIAALTESQKTANGTQDSLTKLTEKVFDTTKPIPARIITSATRLNTVFDSAKPSDTTVIIFGSVTKEYSAFKGYIQCATPFHVKEGLLNQGVMGASLFPSEGYSNKTPISFLGATWKTSDVMFALVDGPNLDPTTCHIEAK